jgi:predicted O-methyltransferase YrrM
MEKFHLIDPDVRKYILSVSARESKNLEMIRMKTASHPCAKMQIPPEEGQFLALLVKIISARRILEIGTFTGYSTLAMAEALPDDGKIIAIDKNREWTSRAERFWKEAGADHKIDLRIGEGVQILESISCDTETAPFDLIFIDADKKSYPAYYEYALRLSHSGTLIAIDNTLWRANLDSVDTLDENGRILLQFNQSLHEDNRIDLSILPVADGLTIARVR